MVIVRRIALLVTALLALAAAAMRAPTGEQASGRLAITEWPYLAGSIIPLRVDGFAPPYRATVLGPGRLSAGGFYEIPNGSGVGSALLIAGNGSGLAAATVRIGGPPSADRGLLVVASYDDGLIFHDARSFSVLGVLATGGTPSDVAIDRLGRIAAPDTQGSELTLATLSPWSVARIAGVALGDEVAIDESSKAVFVTNRDANGGGALTRVSPDRRVTVVATGTTAEGLAIDERRQVVYVANASDGTVAMVDARSMRVLRRFHTVDRVFSLALSPDGKRLYAVSNQSSSSLFGAPGSVVAFALDGPSPRVAARSSALAFPLGAALDASTQTLFITDEQLAEVDVLDARTLRAKRAPLRTCATPWKPSLDAASERLYVPCAGSNAIDAFDARTMRRLRNAPFPTGSYPLAVAIWRPREDEGAARSARRR